MGLRQNLLGLDDGATEGFELGAGGVGLRDIDGPNEGLPDGKLVDGL